MPFLQQNDNGISLMNQFVLQIASTVALEDSWLSLRFHVLPNILKYESSPLIRVPLVMAVLCGPRRAQECTKAKYKIPEWPKDLLWCKAGRLPSDWWFLWFLALCPYTSAHCHTKKNGWLLNIHFLVFQGGKIVFWEKLLPCRKL